MKNKPSQRNTVNPGHKPSATLNERDLTMNSQNIYDLKMLNKDE